MFLMIENKGVAPLEAYTVLGASTARGSSEAIGQFGTGAKHAVALLLRHDLQPLIYLGDQLLEFNARPMQMSGKEFELITLNGKDLGFVKSFGEMDWTDLDLAFREFISNALDQSESFEEVKVELVTEISPRAGYTRVYVKAEPGVIEFYTRRDKWFLHFKSPELLNATVLEKTGRHLDDERAAVVYRRGVRVREFMDDSTARSMFDYNVDVAIDEVRKANDWAVCEAIAHALANTSYDNILELMVSLERGVVLVEHEVNSNAFREALQDWSKPVWKRAFEDAFGKSACACSAHTMDTVARKGFRPVVCPAPFKAALKAAGVPCDASLLTSDDIRGIQVCEMNAWEVNLVIKKLWAKLNELQLTAGCSPPSGKLFVRVSTDGIVLNSYYNENVVYVNRNIVGESVKFKAVILNELVKHITGSNESSTNYTNFLLEVSIHLLEPVA